MINQADSYDNPANERAESATGSPRTLSGPHSNVMERQSSSSRGLTFRAFSSLKDLPPEPDWLWRGYLAPGTLTMLAGHPFAGKSMLVGGLLRALEWGAPFLGKRTKQTTAVVVTEEDDGGLRARADVLGLLDLRSTYVSRSSGALALEWPSLVDQATEHALRLGHGLLVIDTFPGLAGLQAEEENDAAAITERLRPLQVASGEGLAILFLHHMNAQSQPRGSRAFRGVVDASIRFLRNEKATAFRLETESRFPTATPAVLKAKLIKAADGWFYEAVGPGDHAQESESDSGTDVRLREALVEAGPNARVPQLMDTRSG